MLSRKPKPGDRIAWPPSPYSPNGSTGVVIRFDSINENLCWWQPNDQDKPSVFIWRFSDGLNKLATIAE